MNEQDTTVAPHGWDHRILSDVFSVSSGEGLTQTRMRPGPFPVYGGNGIAGFHDAYLFKVPRLIIGRVGEYCGNVCVTEPQSWVTDNALLTTFHVHPAHLTFWCYLLNHIGLNNYAFAAAQPVITGGILKRIWTSLPPLPEQRKIARILTTLDELIEKTEALIAKYQAIKQGMMHDLFTRGIDEHGRLRPSQSEAPELYKQSELGWIPKEWEDSTLEQVCTWVSGGTPSKSNPRYWCGSIPWVSPKDMKVFDLSDTEDHITDEAARLGSRMIPAGAVLVVIRGMILAHSFPVALTSRDMAFNQDIKALLCGDALTARYVAYWLVSSKSRILALATASTHGTMRFDLSDLRKVSFVNPRPAERSRIVAVIDSLDVNRDRDEKQLAKLRKFKAGLMQDLLTGKVRVKVNTTEDTIYA